MLNIEHTLYTLKIHSKINQHKNQIDIVAMNIRTQYQLKKWMLEIADFKILYKFFLI